MRICTKVFIIAGLQLLSITSYSQVTENGGWIFLSHTQKLSNKFDLLADVQLRSADEYAYLSTLLLRGALNYHINKHHAVAAGYTYKGDWEKESDTKTYMREHRIYEQYLYIFKLKRTELTVRTRLEQRFVQNSSIDFSQRARLFISAQIPLLANKEFTKGWYTTLQNELFVNVQHKDVVNHHFFDQNRPFASVGYRWNKKIDTEIGYMYWFQHEKDGNYGRNIIEIMVTTSF
jgi:hypothetical protein